ncbi:MAG: transcriptional repressor [Cryobacterium sp.]|nr:transcriptional repressor [Oligoflexia bacterium]
MKAKAPTSPPSRSLPCGRPLPKLENTGEDGEQLLANLNQRLEQYVSDRRLNRSEARAKILETIVFEARHFTPQDLLAHLGKRFPEVGKATLYRNLPVLVESGILQEGPTDSEGQSFYELSDGEHHDHIVCTDCHRIFEFHDETIERRQDSVAEGMKFKTQSHRHVIYASCSYRKLSD